MNAEAIESTVQSLQWIYTVVIALAIGEAIGKVVGKEDGNGDNRIQWNRLPALIAFVFIIVPFYHGMGRYLQTVYDPSSPPSTFGWSYGMFLLFDVAVFAIEAFLFFVLARSLQPKNWTQSCGAVMILLMVDIVWGVSVLWLHDMTEIRPWVNINCIVCLAFSVLLALRRWLPHHSAGLWVVTVVVILRTVCDYIFTWSFYFP